MARDEFREVSTAHKRRARGQATMGAATAPTRRPTAARTPAPSLPSLPVPIASSARAGTPLPPPPLPLARMPHDTQPAVPAPAYMLVPVPSAPRLPAPDDTGEHRDPLAQLADILDTLSGRPVPPLLLNLKDAAHALGITVRTLYALRERGHIRIVPIGTRKLVPWRELERYVEWLIEQSA